MSKNKTLALYFALMARRNWPLMLLELVTPSLIFLLIAAALLAMGDPAEIKTLPKPVALRFFPDNLTNYTRRPNPIWFGIAPDSPKARQFADLLQQSLNKSYEVRFFQQDSEMQQFIRNANLYEREQNDMKVLATELKKDIERAQIPYISIDPDKFDEQFNEKYRSQVLKITQAESREILFGISLDLTNDNVNYSVHYNHLAINRFHNRKPDKFCTQFTGYQESPFFSPYIYKFQIAVEESIIRVQTGVQSKEITIHRLPFKSANGQNNWQQAYFSLLLVANFVFVFTCVLISKFRQNSYALLKRLGVGDFVFWICLWIFLFLLMYFSLTLLFSMNYALNKLPFAAYPYVLTWIIPIPFSACLVSFATFFGMLIKSDKLLIIIGTLFMLCFTVFPILLSVFSSDLKPIWDPSLIPVALTWIFFTISPILSTYGLLENLVSVLPKTVINNFSLELEQKFTLGYLFNTQWENQQYPGAMDPTISYHLVSFSTYWITLSLQTLSFFLLTVYLSYVKPEQKQIGLPLFFFCQKQFYSKCKKEQLSHQQTDPYTCKTLLRVQNISCMFGKKQVLNNISFEVKENQIVGIIGSSASGKTTLMNILSSQLKLCKKEDQELVLNGVNLIDPYARAEASQIIGICPQDKSNIFDFLQIKDNIQLCMKFTGNVDSELTSYLVKSLNLDNCLNKTFQQLSGGMQRRFALLLALIQKPKLLLLDEMTANVDPLLKRQIWEAIIFYKSKHNCTIILTSHDSQEIVQMADTVMFLKDGKIQFQETVEQINTRCSFVKFILEELTVQEQVEDLFQSLELPFLLQSQLKEYVYQIRTNDLDKISALLENVSLHTDRFRVESYPVNEVLYGKIDEVAKVNHHDMEKTNKPHKCFQFNYQFQKIFFESKSQHFMIFVGFLLFTFFIAIVDYVVSMTMVPGANFDEFTGFMRLQAAGQYIKELKFSSSEMLQSALLNNRNSFEVSPTEKNYKQTYYSKAQRYHDILNLDVFEKYSLSFGDQTFYHPNLQQLNYFVKVIDESVQSVPSVKDQLTNNVISLANPKTMFSVGKSSYSLLRQLSQDEKKLVNYLNTYENLKFFPISLNPTLGKAISPVIVSNNVLKEVNSFYQRQINYNHSQNYGDMSQIERDLVNIDTPLGIINIDQKSVQLHLMIPQLVTGRYYSSLRQLFLDGKQVELYFAHHDQLDINQKYQVDIDETYFVNLQNDIISKIQAMNYKQIRNDKEALFQGNYVTQPQYSDLPKKYPKFWSSLYNAEFVAYYFQPFTYTILLVFILKNIHSDLTKQYRSFLNGVCVNSISQILVGLLVNSLVFLMKMYITMLLYYLLVYSESYDQYQYWIIAIFFAFQSMSFTYFMILIFQNFGIECLYLCFSSILIIIINSILQPNLFFSAILSIIFPSVYYITLCRMVIRYEVFSTYTIIFGALLSFAQLSIVLLVQFIQSNKNKYRIKKAASILKVYQTADNLQENQIVTTTDNDALFLVRSGTIQAAEQSNITVLEANDIQAYYSKKQIILHDFNLRIQKNQTTCLIGINGSGKSTFLKCLTGNQVKYTGNIILNAKIGIVPQDDVCFDLLTVRQNLQLMCNFSGREVEEVIHQFCLQQEENIRAKDLASGQRRRLTIAMAVVTQPSLLILDEVTVGLDYELKMQVWSVILQLRNCAIMAITHDMHEVDTLADQACILDKGKIIASGDINNIKQMGNSLYNVQVFQVQQIEELQGVSVVQNVDGSHTLGFEKQFSLKQIVQYLKHLNINNKQMTWSIESVQMESVFMDVLHNNYE